MCQNPSHCFCFVVAFMLELSKKKLPKKICQKNVAGSRQCEGGVKARSNKSQGKVRSRQRNHNLNCKYNLMDFDTIEINLVLNLK